MLTSFKVAYMFDKVRFCDLPVSLVNAIDEANGGFFMSFKWFSNFVDAVVKPMKTEAFIVYEDSTEPKILLPVMYLEAQSLRVIKCLSNYYSPIFSVVNSEKLQSQLQLVNFFVNIKSRLPIWDVIELRPLTDIECSFLINQLKTAGIPAIGFFCFGNWFLDVNSQSFNDYFSKLPSQLKSTILRKSKKFYSIDGARLEIVTNEQGLTEGLASYEAVYNASWKISEPYPEFMPGLIKVAESIGGLRLGLAYLDGKAIAAQFWIVADNTAYIFKLAYDDDYKKYSIGTILTAKMMEYVIDVDKVDIVDYLCGDEDYKKDWMSNRRERWGVMGFNTSTKNGCIAYVKERAKSHLKRILNLINNVH